AAQPEGPAGLAVPAVEARSGGAAQPRFPAPPGGEIRPAARSWRLSGGNQGPARAGHKLGNVGSTTKNAEFSKLKRDRKATLRDLFKLRVLRDFVVKTS